jgi:hypothetical protein
MAVCLGAVDAAKNQPMPGAAPVLQVWPAGAAGITAGLFPTSFKAGNPSGGGFGY